MRRCNHNQRSGADTTALKDKTMSNAINPLMDMVQDGRLGGTGASRYNELGLELDRKVHDAVKAILEEAVKEHGPIDIRMFGYIAMMAAQEVTLAELF
jgi:hypothetical protein